MKKIILIPVLLFIVACASAQPNLRFNLYGSYVFDDSFDEASDLNTYFRGKVKGGLQWGGGLEYLTSEYSSIELLYLNKTSTAPVDFKIGVTNPADHEDFDVSLNYILLAGNGLKELKPGKIEGFGSFMLGALITNVDVPSSGESGSNTSFAWGGRLGTNIWMSPKVGIKLQAQVLASSKATGGELYFSYYGPIVLETYTTLWQFGLGGGLTFKLGK